MHNFQKIAVVGYGNVGWHLVQDLHALTSCQLIIFSNSINGINDLDKKRVTIVNQLNQLNDLKPDLVFLSVRDQNIFSVVENLHNKLPIVITSGTVKSSDLTKKGFKLSATFYPFQSFRKYVELHVKNYPVFITSEDIQMISKLTDLALQLKKTPVVIDEKQKPFIHLAGVLANNFTNFLYIKAYQFLQKSDVSPEHLVPLIMETALRLQSISPDQVQTGPAIRNDKQIVIEHLNLIEDPQLKELYKIFSEFIYQYFSSKS